MAEREGVPVAPMSGAMQHPEEPCTWCGCPLAEPRTQEEAAWGDLWLGFSLLWGPRPQHDFCGALCPACGTLLVRYAVDPQWRTMLEEACRLAEEHGFGAARAYRRLVEETHGRSEEPCAPHECAPPRDDDDAHDDSGRA